MRGRNGRSRRRRGAQAGAGGRWALDVLALGAQAGRRRSGREAGARGARGLGARPGGWGRGLGERAGQGCALGALGLFLARFDSVLFLSH